MIGDKLLTGERRIDFVRLWKKAVLVSAILVVVSVVSLVARGLEFGIDFEGGISWEVQAPAVSAVEAREALEPLGLGEAKVQIIGEDIVRVQAGTSSTEKEAAVSAALADLAGVEVTEVSVSTVGPSWGDEITRSAVRALVFFFIAILLYLSLRLEWRMAVAAIIAVLHDIILSVGFYSVTHLEVTPATVIAFLTILGYSIYDTVVVFDKVQENSSRPSIAAKTTYPVLVSNSMNQVLMRSVNTTAVALIPVLAILIVGSVALGVTILREFSVALAVGLGVGAYSSIFIAAPALVWLRRNDPGSLSREDRAARAKAGIAARRAAAEGDPSAKAKAATVTVDMETSVPTRDASEAPTSPLQANPPRPRKKKRR